jgi:hypothetical protein
MMFVNDERTLHVVSGRSGSYDHWGLIKAQVAKAAKLGDRLGLVGEQDSNEGIRQ